MPNLEWPVDYHTQHIAMIIDRNEAVLSTPVKEITYTDTYLLLRDMRQIEVHNSLLIDVLRAHKESTPKSKLGKILAILRS